jgi:hypothetical protein
MSGLARLIVLLRRSVTVRFFSKGLDMDRLRPGNRPNTNLLGDYCRCMLIMKYQKKIILMVGD